MGALHSLIDAPIDGYPTKSHRNANCCCKSCGMQYDRPRADSAVNHALWAHSHYLAELCGIWLGNPDTGQPPSSQQQQNARHSLNKMTDASPFGAFPSSSSTTLPKRSVSSSSKPSLIVSTLIKHTDFTKNERSALKHGFFSTVDMDMAGLSDCSGLAGCHIRGCLYVEHDSLVFQAVDSTHRLPSVLTNRKEESYESPVPQSLLADRRRRTRGSDPTAPGTNDPTDYSHPALRSSSIPISACRKTRRRLWTYFQDGRGSPSLPAGLSRSYRKDLKFNDLLKSDDSKCTNSDYKNGQLPQKKSVDCRGDSQRVQDSDHTDHDIGRLPPPPLRLSWPLCTLRRFGFYGNTLFKLEAGRRAPRGEGHYLFRIKTLKEFRQYFEHFVHRRKSLSPPKSPTHHHPVPASILRQPPSTPFYPNEFEVHHHPDGPDSLSTQLLHITPCHPSRSSTHSPLHNGLFRSSIPCPCDSDLDNMLNPIHAKQKANSLTHSSGHTPKISPTCLDWVRQQQQQHQQHHRQNCFQNSCPHLSSSMFVMSAPKSHPLICAESDADELISLPDPPPPPPVSAGPMDLMDFQKIYDNVDLDWLNSGATDNPSTLEHRNCEQEKMEDSVNSGRSRDWHSSTAMLNPPSRGRLYTSRRAMTAFACSTLYPIPSRQQEEDEEDENHEASRTISDAVRYEFHMTDDCSAAPDSLYPINPIGVVDKSQNRKVSNGTHLRHTSLPNPISVDTLLATSSSIAVSGGDGALSSQADLSNHTQSPPTDTNRSNNLTSVVCETRLDEAAHLPYYNLSSPEALCHLVRTGSSSRSASIRNTFPSSEYAGTATFPNKTLPTDPCPPRVNPVGHSSHTHSLEDSHGIDSVGGHAVPDSCSDSYRPPIHPHCRTSTSSSHPNVSPEREPFSSILHYATLDFSPPSPDRARLSVDLDTTGSGCTTEHCVHENNNHNNPIDERATVTCPMRVYGTFVHDPNLARNTLDSATRLRVRSLSSSDPSSAIRPSSISNVDNELPENYVAICQLQTLAMRAVLNATT